MNNIFAHLIHFLATGLYSGKIPYAPGTAGSLLAVILLKFYSGFKSPLSILLFSAAGIYICSYEAKRTGIKDKGEVVIDEITGIFLVFLNIPLSPLNLVLGFSLFRIFDIVKPGPIDSSQHLPSGLGVMADDLLAALTTLLIMNFFLYIT
ncbi:MAG: phosphatidylglycerophosphatase A [Halanaerobiales bacterium]